MKRTYKTSPSLDKELADKTLRELKLGYMNLSDDFFPQAETNFQLVLQMDSKCADAYWGLMLCKLHVRNEDDLYDSPVTYKNAIYLPECDQALACADENLRKTYQGLLERIYKINEGDNY